MVNKCARTLASTLTERGIELVSGGTDTHMLLLDFSSLGLLGQQAQDRLNGANLTSNKNPIPFDSARPADWKGLRLGVAAATTRGLGESEFNLLGNLIADLLLDRQPNSQELTNVCQKQVLALCEQFPIYAD